MRRSKGTANPDASCGCLPEPHQRLQQQERRQHTRRCGGAAWSRRAGAGLPPPPRPNGAALLLRKSGANAASKPGGRAMRRGADEHGDGWRQHSGRKPKVDRIKSCSFNRPPPSAGKQESRPGSRQAAACWHLHAAQRGASLAAAAAPTSTVPNASNHLHPVRHVCAQEAEGDRR